MTNKWRTNNKRLDGKLKYSWTIFGIVKDLQNNIMKHVQVVPLSHVITSLLQSIIQFSVEHFVRLQAILCLHLLCKVVCQTFGTKHHVRCGCVLYV